MATLGSLFLMLGALAFQYLGGLPPCKLCYWQRYPHILAIAVGAVALWLDRPKMALLGAAAALSSSAVGFYHTGVEQGWWQGPTTCTAGPIGGMSTDDLLDQIMAAPLVRCDDIPWQMLGLSMAAWNAVFSFILVLFWLHAYRRA